MNPLPPLGPLLDARALHTRRQFFGRSALGIGTAALASLLLAGAASAQKPDAVPVVEVPSAGAPDAAEVVAGADVAVGACL